MEERPDGERVGAPRGDRAFRREILEEAHHQHLHINFGVDAPAAVLLRIHLIVRRAEPADGVAELAPGEDLIQLGVEARRGGRGQVRRRDPQRGRFVRRLLPEHGSPRRQRSRPVGRGAIYNSLNPLSTTISTVC